MINSTMKRAVNAVSRWGERGLAVSRAIHRAVLQGGRPTRTFADWLHGTWLGHPLHPVLTDLTIGAWAFGGFFDAVAAATGAREAERMADTLTTAGTVTAVPTLVTGVIDFSTVQRPAASAATLHALLNDANFVLYLLSIRDRRNGRRSRAVVLSGTALTLTAVSAWLGGHLVYGHQVGVDHSKAPDGPEAWTPALDTADLPEKTPQHVEVRGNPILLYRCNGDVYAIGAVCSHAGGPLAEGTFEACTVQCPWHDSVFDLRSGRIVHGPATHPQPRYEAREHDREIEVRQVHP